MPLATPRLQYSRYSEQTLATTHASGLLSEPAGSEPFARLTRAGAISAGSRFSLPRIRCPVSSNKGMRCFVPGGV